MQKSVVPKEAAKPVETAGAGLAWAGGAALPPVYPRRAVARQAVPAGASVSLLLHAGIVVLLFTVDPTVLTPRPPEVVELDVRELPPPPPPEPPPEPPPPPPPKRPVVIPPRVKVAVAPPPPPNTTPKETPPDQPPPPPSFGVTLDSVVGGDSPVAVPVGNTTMTNDRVRAPAPTAPLPASVEGAPSFSPVSEIYVRDFPNMIREVKAEHPKEALRMGLGGTVTMRIGIDRSGAVRSVKLLRKAGHGFDEAASRAMWGFKFTPCKTHQGETVDCVISYSYTFQAGR